MQQRIVIAPTQTNMRANSSPTDKHDHAIRTTTQPNALAVQHYHYPTVKLAIQPRDIDKRRQGQLRAMIREDKTHNKGAHDSHE